jgi:lipopolysaccharide transport system ATP-binding protein
MSDIIISAEKIGKQYNLRRKRKGDATFRDAISGQAAALFKSFGQKLRFRDGVQKPPANGISSTPAKAAAENFWALKDASFEVKQGDVIGIIGRNGAGKSTLLKIMSRITEPTEGRLRIKGRVASLLEVGTGFHPELTGRENIFLNGSILGMSRAEIKSKFDEIVAFSEVEKFLDMPVKRYSSGMYVRLAFAVAAHLEPEVLIIDEVLAVGDAEFQNKCLGKMHDVATGGRTVLFVSHNMQAVSALCNRGMYFRGGNLVHAGGIEETIEMYLANFSKPTGNDQFPERRPGSGEYRFISARPAREYFGGADEKIVNFEIQRRVKDIGRMWFSALVVDATGSVLAQCDSRLVGTRVDDCEGVTGQFRFTTPWLKPGNYRVDLFIWAGPVVDAWEGACTLTISPVLPYESLASEDVASNGVVLADFSWETGNLHRDQDQGTLAGRNGHRPEVLSSVL